MQTHINKVLKIGVARIDCYEYDLQGIQEEGRYRNTSTKF